jgi:hypothetical protein
VKRSMSVVGAGSGSGFLNGMTFDIKCDMARAPESPN